MSKRHLLRDDEPSGDRLREELVAVFGPAPEAWSPPDTSPCDENRVLAGRVLRVCDAEVWVGVGAKSPGAVPLREWYDADAGRVVPPRPGDTVPVLVAAADDATGSVPLSRREAVRWQQWAQAAARYREGDVVRGTVTRVVPGGLLVDIGFEAFLPASQVDIRRPTNLVDYVGHSVECYILRVDAARRAIIVSRRRLIVNEDPMLNRGLLATFEEGQVRAGVVKLIAEFGAFVDLGGIDGLLYVKDMFWGRVNDPRRAVALDQRLEVVLLRVDRQRASVWLGLRRKVPDPAWLTPAVLGVARAIVEGNRPESLPLLADALEEAGCDDATLLGHLRGPGPHDCGRELLDALLAGSRPDGAKGGGAASGSPGEAGARGPAA